MSFRTWMKHFPPSHLILFLAKYVNLGFSHTLAESLLKYHIKCHAAARISSMHKIRAMTLHCDKHVVERSWVAVKAQLGLQQRHLISVGAQK